jgi:hypothetical protein
MPARRPKDGTPAAEMYDMALRVAAGRPLRTVFPAMPPPDVADVDGLLRYMLGAADMAARDCCMYGARCAARPTNEQ